MGDDSKKRSAIEMLIKLDEPVNILRFWLTNAQLLFQRGRQRETFYLQQLSTFQAVNFDVGLIKINWKIRKFLKFENTLTSFDECAIFKAVY